MSQRSRLGFCIVFFCIFHIFSVVFFLSRFEHLLMWFLRSWLVGLDEVYTGILTRIHALLLDLLTVGHANFCLMFPLLLSLSVSLSLCQDFFFLFRLNLQVLTNRTF